MKNWLDHLSEDQKKWLNEGIDHHPAPLEACPHGPGTDVYAWFEEGWWLADD